MNRTPRSARRRASRQLDANDPSPGCAPYIRRCFLDPCQLLDQSRDSGFGRASVRAVVLDGSHRSNSAAAGAAGSLAGLNPHTVPNCGLVPDVLAQAPTKKGTPTPHVFVGGRCPETYDNRDLSLIHI